MSEIIQGLWVGTELSVMERLSIASFLRNGHEYHLYVYGGMENVPEGTVIRDAGEILPESSVFQYRQVPSYAGFANFFRYKLVLERGGWWADTDTVCLRPFDFPEEYVFSSETIHGGREVINSGVFEAPPRSPAMAYAWEVCRSKDTARLVWGETGPKLMAETVTRHGLERFRQPHRVFCPLSYLDWHKVLEPDAALAFDHSTRAVHLWNERWRATGQDKNAAYHPDCLYEQLKRKYLNF